MNDYVERKNVSTAIMTTDSVMLWNAASVSPFCHSSHNGVDETTGGLMNEL